MKLSNIEFTAFVGLDWADSKHDICVQAVGCEAREFDRFRHKVAAIDEWALLLPAPCFMQSLGYAPCPTNPEVL